MNGEQIMATILGREVRLFGRYAPERAMTGQLIGRESELRMVTTAWMAGRSHLPLAPLLVGQPGVGKNRLVYEIVRQTGKDLYIFQGHDDVAAEDLACSIRFSDHDNRQMDYTVSPLVTAMHLGQVCFIDEIAKIRPRALALLVSVLDERRYIDSNLLGGRLMAHEGFRFIAATNTADLEGNAIPAFIRSRLHPIIEFGYPKRDEIDDIVKNRFLEDQKQVPELLHTFWEEWGKLRVSRPPSPRDAISVFSLALSHSSYENHRSGGSSDHTAVEPRHVADAIEDLAFDFKEAR